MSIQTMGRCGAALFFVALVSGCSFSGNDEPGRGYSRALGGGDRVGDDCRGNRKGCLYNGSYEAGEEAFAEQEARRLNQASLNRLRRSAR